MNIKLPITSQDQLQFDDEIHFTRIGGSSHEENHIGRLVGFGAHPLLVSVKAENGEIYPVPFHNITKVNREQPRKLGIQIIEQAKKVRDIQKAYYRYPTGPGGGDEKKRLLIASKQAEADLDKLLKQYFSE